MSLEIIVPEMGESVIEATVRQWLKKEGDFVEAGEALVELETDKVNLEVGAKASGVLAKINVGEGQDVKVGDVLGSINADAKQPASNPRRRACHLNLRLFPRRKKNRKPPNCRLRL